MSRKNAPLRYFQGAVRAALEGPDYGEKRAVNVPAW